MAGREPSGVAEAGGRTAAGCHRGIVLDHATLEFAGGHLSAFVRSVFTSESATICLLLASSFVFVRCYLSPGHFNWAADSSYHLAYADITSATMAFGELPFWTYLGTGSPYLQFYGFLFFWSVGLLILAHPGYGYWACVFTGLYGLSRILVSSDRQADGNGHPCCCSCLLWDSLSALLWCCPCGWIWPTPDSPMGITPLLAFRIRIGGRCWCGQISASGSYRPTAAQFTDMVDIWG